MAARRGWAVIAFERRGSKRRPHYRSRGPIGVYGDKRTARKQQRRWSRSRQVSGSVYRIKRVTI